MILKRKFNLHYKHLFVVSQQQLKEYYKDLVNFFFILAGGWLTNTLIDMINANADGNVDLLKSLKGKLNHRTVSYWRNFDCNNVWT